MECFVIFVMAWCWFNATESKPQNVTSNFTKNRIKNSMENNFLNLTEAEKDQPIYRVVTIERLFQLFDEKLNVLVNPKKWDDPFENFIMNSLIEFKSGISISIGFRENVYGQCWTKTRESDAMWRIYSPEKNGVRITTTPRKLLKALTSCSDNPKNQCYIGKVKYLTTIKLKEILEKDGSKLIFENSGIGLAKSLLFKRTPFKHENEIRLIFNSLGKFESEIMKFEIEPLDLIDDIVFDPRIEYSKYKEYKKRLRLMNFEKRIVKSNLYQIPNLKISV